jgi:uncharacterized membrane protein YcaP (DUF421 family)
VEIVIRVSIIFFFVWAITRALGKRELAEMTAFELVLLITIGDLVQQGATQDDTSVTGTLLTVSTITIWVLLLSYLGFRWGKARHIIEGKPVLVIDHGHLLEAVLRVERISADEVLETARVQGIERLADIRWGILEADGKFAFVLNEPTPSHHRRTVITDDRTSA